MNAYFVNKCVDSTIATTAVIGLYVLLSHMKASLNYIATFGF